MSIVVASFRDTCAVRALISDSDAVHTSFMTFIASLIALTLLVTTVTSSFKRSLCNAAEARATDAMCRSRGWKWQMELVQSHAIGPQRAW